MRHIRAALVVLLACSYLGWGLSAAPAGATSAGPAAAGVAAPAQTADITVSETADDKTICSLREALQLLFSSSACGPALNPPNADVVNIKLNAGTYLLSIDEDLPTCCNGKTVYISGNGVVIDGGSLSSRKRGIFHVTSGSLNLLAPMEQPLVLQYGSRTGGGAIWRSGGTVTAVHVRFLANNAAVDPNVTGAGGAILNETGDLTVTESVFVNNLAFDIGGAVSTNVGYFFKDEFVGNRAYAGGALQIRSQSSSPVTVVQSDFKQNLARPQTTNQMPGPNYQPRSDTSGGGAIQNKGNLVLTQVLIEGNRTEMDKGGGGLSNESSGTAVLSETVVTKNTAAALGSVDSNQYITSTWGGGIYNAGLLDLVRASVHGNQADYAGAIFNHAPGNLGLYNSTISNNKANQIVGGIMNEYFKFDNSGTLGALIFLVHATIGQNGSQSDSTLYARDPRTIYFSNSILDGPCNVVQYTRGNSVMTGFCDTEQDPGIVPVGGADISMTTKTQLGLQPLAEGNSDVPEFMVQPIDGSSIAAAITTRDDQYGCSQPNINHLDQNLATRPPHECAAGAFQANTPPAHFESIPPLSNDADKPSYIKFPEINSNLGQSMSQVSLVLKNTGGKALNYFVGPYDSPGSSAIVNDTPSTNQGTIYRGGQVTLNFSCHPQYYGAQYRKKLVVSTNAPEGSGYYEFICVAIGTRGFPVPKQDPRPVNMANLPPGQTTHTGLDISNPGPTPLTAQPALASPGAPFSINTTVTNGPAPASPAATLNPGQTLHMDVACTPAGPGVFLNTLVVNTSDPNNPSIKYDLSCEAQVNSPPEALSPATTYATGSQMEGVAVSPDGGQVLAGDSADNTLQVLNLDPATGNLSDSGFPAAWPGMSQVYGVQYSHDGKNVYYTSQAGNGIVVGNRSGPGLNLTEAITSGTTYTCFVIFLTTCPIGSMLGARGLAVSPDDQYVYVVGNSDGTLTAFQRDLATGLLSYSQTITRTIGGVNVLGGAMRVSTSPDGAHVYVAAYNDNSVSVFQRDATGRLDFQAVYTNGSPGLTNLLNPTDVAVSPDGNFVYVAANGSSALNIFNRSSADGGLTLSTTVTGLTGAWGVALTHDDAGKRLFLANFDGNNVQVYGRDQVTGAVNLIGTYGESGPVFLAVSPDNKDVYASLFYGQGVALLQTVRNTPVLSHISPASAVVGGSAFTLTVVGGSFYPDSHVVWNIFSPPTQFINEHELQAQIPAAYINAPTSVAVSVLNTSPGGGFSTTSQPFAITAPADPPVPSIDSLDPPAASFGGGDLVLLVHGANFAPSALVYYNHASVPTLFINDHLLQITLSADIMNTPGDGGLEVVNGGAPALSAPASPDAPATSTSSTIVSFKISPPGTPAVPALTRLAPASVSSGSAPIWLTLTGHNFSTNPKVLSIGRWNGLARSSIVLDAHTLLMELTQTDLATAGNGLVTVLTPGTGASAAVKFRVRLPNEKPIPVVTSVSSRAFTLYVNGSDFDPAAQISLNGTPRATTFVNQYEVKTTLTAADHGVVITVFNPGPGGGLSNDLVAFFSRSFLPIVRR